MEKYNPLTPEVIAELKRIVGEKHVITDPDGLDTYKTDQETDPHLFHTPEAVVAPDSTAQVAAIMKLANQYGFAVTPRSGGTSVSDGAIAVYGGVVMLMERMNKIEKIDPDGMYMVVQAGVRTLDVQQAARKEGMFYAGDPCSADSCLIGGNLATNAGGDKAVRYGTTRNQVHAIEVVLPTGEIANLGARTKKNTTGYCLDQLVLGSEGTLGIITRATLKLLPIAPYKSDVLLIFTDPRKATSIVPVLLKAGLNPTSVEFMDNGFVRASSDYSKIRLNHYEDGAYVILTLETYDEDEMDRKLVQVDELARQNGAVEVSMADDRVWTIRKNCLEGTRILSRVSTSDDFVVPLDQIADTIMDLSTMAQAYPFRIFTLAHAGDGNLHFNILKGDLSDEEWENALNSFHAKAYAYVYGHGGLLSGEHGIGAKKIHQLKTLTDPGQMLMMTTIKKALDPLDVLNPGKVIEKY
jgi:glycolate oxidase